MADKEVGDLTSATTLDGTELLHLVQGGNSRQATAADIVGISHSQPWSSVTGTPTTLSGYGITDAQPKDSDLTAIAALSPTSNAVMVGNGSAWTTESGSTLRASLGLSIGSDVQAYDATLTALAGLSLSSGDIIYATGANSFAALNSGSDGQVLRLSGGAPTWGDASGIGDMLVSTYDPNSVGGDAFDQDNMVDGTTNKNYTATEQSKLSGIEALADVTDATNVAAAGAVMESDTSVASMAFVGTGSDLSIDPDKLAKRGDVGDAIKLDRTDTKSLTTRIYPVIKLREFGADPLATDNTAAINKAFSVLRDLSGSTYFKSITIDGEGQIYPCTGSIDATGIWGDNKGMVVRDFTILSSAAGKVALDIVGSNLITWQNVWVEGGSSSDADDWCLGGWQLCPTTTAATECFGHTFINCGCDGQFTDFGFMNYGAELTNEIACKWMNRANPDTTGSGHPCFAYVSQSTDCITPVSDFQTVVTGFKSNTHQKRYGCQVQKPYGVPGPALMIQGPSNHKWHGLYVTAGDHAAIEWRLVTGESAFDIELDLQCETTGVDTLISFVGDDSNADYDIADFTLRCGNLFPASQIFYASTLSHVNIEHGKITVSKMNYAGLPTNDLFGTPAMFRLRDVELVSPGKKAQSIVALAEFSGRYYDRTNDIAYIVGGMRHVGTNRVQLNDDGMQEIDLPASYGRIEVFTSAIGYGGSVAFRATSSPAVTLSTVGTNTVTTTSAMTDGTTTDGTDGKLNIGVQDGKLQIKNRSSFVVWVWWNLIVGE